MSRSIRFHPRAKEEYEEALSYYQERSEDAALRFEASINTCLLRIADDPERYFSHSGIRCCRVIVFPYFIHYREGDSEIQIVAVAHQKRKPGYWLSRVADN
ncbi:MAG: type II toxin-antitoxin system RelE/ParE family toxin [Coriobacteriales bacterium]|jgi:plasmid stabilization system protein ParE|nr:type II toxin-antitoxin system RelE/ParE family toxin [Coriobacteriales bacterium]